MAHKLVSHVICKQRFFVYKINNVNFSERLFCIFDKDKPYELSVEYKELSTSLEAAPIIGGKGGGFQLQQKIDTEKYYSFRLSTKEECQKHINEIEKKRELINDLLINFTNELMIEYNKKTVKEINNFNNQLK